jgi:hypothetical protein
MGLQSRVKGSRGRTGALREVHESIKEKLAKRSIIKR